ncbi:hypothetical protein HOV00_gp27 [Microbacterium phage Schubert]|uniref:Uncharacterized protein n=1 Tax=Microbacterium phage Schubert TaxID=2500787 RepID=A0A3Q9RAB9_9CAUD|nr:hypothetical protein HOV00_gp27 [Microbacterium phage Schubert]AZV01734.1 hypothetical protein SEA_SCHUBERT_27 [Microbacterium phage Schubert]
MTNYYEIGGNFRWDGNLTNFTTYRIQNSGKRAYFSITYSEGYRGNSIIMANANSYWMLGIRRRNTSTIYWCMPYSSTGGTAQSHGWFLGGYSNLPAGEYAVSAKAYSSYPNGYTGNERIRFGGTLALNYPAR